MDWLDVLSMAIGAFIGCFLYNFLKEKWDNRHHLACPIAGCGFSIGGNKREFVAMVMDDHIRTHAHSS